LRKTIVDESGLWRYGKWKGTPLEDVPDYVLGETCAWGQRIVEETQAELDRRLAELRYREGQA